jgi:hypothetical protein
MTAKMPRISGYGQYSSDNYGVNCLKVQFDKLTLWYSYETVIAFRADGETVVSENYWQTTTGKHLNWIDNGDKKSRLSRPEFEKQLTEDLQSLGLSE